MLGLAKEAEVRLFGYFRNMKMHSLNAVLLSKSVFKTLSVRYRIIVLQKYSGLFQPKDLA